MTAPMIDQIALLLERQRAAMTPAEIGNLLGAPAETVQSAIDDELALQDAKVKPASAGYRYNSAWRIRYLRH